MFILKNKIINSFGSEVTLKIYILTGNSYFQCSITISGSYGNFTFNASK